MILSSGSGPLRVSVPAGSTLIIRNYSGTETVTGSSSAREDASSTLGSGSVVYGPQSVNSELTISTTGQLDYQVVAGDPTPARASAGMDYFRDRIRAGASRVRPFMTQKHIVDYPAWSSGMTVQAGTTVKSSVSGVNQLFAWLGNGGTSTTQPTVMNTWKPQADAGIAGSGSDTRGWIYIGPERRDTRMAAEIASYTYTTTTPAGLTSYGAWNASSPLRQLGVIENLSNDCWVKVQAGDAIEGRAGWKRKDATQVSGTGSVAFYTDTDLIAWSMFNDSTRQDFNFEVDDVPYSFTPLDRATNGIRVLQFTNRRRRLIRIHNVGGIMQNIYMRAGEQIEPVTDLLAQRMLWVGDSYHGGAAPGPLVFPGFIPNHVARNLGLPYMHNPSIGGRGFEFEGGTPATDNSLTQMLELDAAKHAESKYMAAWICMSGNDTGRPTAALRDSYIRTLRLLRNSTRFNDSPIFVCTRFNGAGSTEANEMNALMNQVLAEVGDQYTFLIPMGTDRPTGGALVNAMNNNFYIGTSDIHPFDGGHRLFADYVSDQVLRIMGLTT